MAETEIEKDAPESTEKGMDPWDLRPKFLSEYIGQSRVVESLQIAIEAARRREEPLDHVMFHSPPGLGKTTLAHIIAKEMGVNIVTSSGPAIERGGELISILTHLERGDVLFIDEIHRLPKVVEEFLYPAMEDFCIDFVFDRGAHARSHRYRLQPFTLVGATTRFGLLTPPMRARFGIVQRLVDRVVTAPEDQILRAIYGLAAEEHLVAEGAGAATVAALLAERLPVTGRRVVAIVSGANIDVDRLGTVLRKESGFGIQDSGEIGDRDS